MDTHIYPISSSEDQNDTKELRRGTKEKNKSDSRENSAIRKKVKLNTKNETEDSRKSTRVALELESDPLILQRRQKQIDYGKNTVGYHCYITQVPIEQRTKDDPKTPDKYIKYSRRSWDMLIKMWRKKLHQYDTEANKEATNESDKSSSDSLD